MGKQHVSWCVFFLCCGYGVVLCCPLQVNWLWTSVVNVGFAEIVNGGLDGCSSCSLDMAGATGESGGAALMGAQETQRLLRRSSSGSQVSDFVCCLERIVEFGLEIRECRLENTC